MWTRICSVGVIFNYLKLTGVSVKELLDMYDLYLIEEKLFKMCSSVDFKYADYKQVLVSELSKYYTKDGRRPVSGDDYCIRRYLPHDSIFEQAYLKGIDAVQEKCISLVRSEMDGSLKKLQENMCKLKTILSLLEDKAFIEKANGAVKLMEQHGTNSKN